MQSGNYNQCIWAGSFCAAGSDPIKSLKIMELLGCSDLCGDSCKFTRDIEKRAYKLPVCALSEADEGLVH